MEAPRAQLAAKWDGVGCLLCGEDKAREKGKLDNHSLLRANSFLPLAAGGNPAVPGPRESNKRSD